MIELQDDTNLFGDSVAAKAEINRDELARALHAALKDITLEQFVAMFTNPFEAVVDYAGLCAGEKTGQRISLLFNPHRLDTGTKRFPLSLYSKLKDASFISGLARVVLLNRKKGATKDLLYASVGMGVQGTSYVQEFPPHVARDLALDYGMSKNCSILDPCAGWGGRMLGFSAVANAYTCCDPSARTAQGLRQLYRFIKSFRSDFQAQINEAPFEDVELPAAAFDFAMTSPPYYDTEHYAPGEKSSSMNRYANFEEWSAGFYAPLIHRTMRALKPGSVFILNIGSRIYPLNEKLQQIAADKYVVAKQKDRLSASKGLGKTGEGETFYEVKNPGLYVAPDALPIIVSTVVDPAEVAFAASLLVSQDSTTVDEKRTTAENAAADIVETAAPDPPLSAAAVFDPLASFLASVEAKPAVDAASASAEAAKSEPDTLNPEPESVALTPEPGPALTAADVERTMRAAGHEIFARAGKLIITNAAQLTDENRELIKAHKPELLLTVPLMPEENSAPQALVHFLGTPVAAHPHDKPKDWVLEMPPDLHDNDKDWFLDGEFDGLDWHGKANLIGFSLRNVDGSFRRYLPIRHQGTSENLPEEQVVRWAQRNLRNKYIRNANTRIDVHFMRKAGMDLVEQDCTFGDVMHYAALLDDHRKRFAVDVLSQDFLGREKIGKDLDPTRMAHYEPWVVAARALGDVDIVADLCKTMWPKLDAEELQRVRQLEDDVLPVTVELEKNGVRIDVELLHEWTRASEEHYYAVLKSVSEEAGFTFDGSDAALLRLFEKFKIPLTLLDSGKPTFKDEVLERVEHPVIQTARFAAQLDSLRSKIYKPYSEMVGNDGVLHVEFNQLRGDDGGTVSGRYSAGYIQQVPNKDNHYAVFGDMYDPRKLVIAAPGKMFFSADAEQIEYRIFASLAQNPKILQAYRDAPWINFHKYMYPMIKVHAPADFSYTNQKQTNFMTIYGGGIVKTAVMMKHITSQQGDEITAARAQKTSPLLDRARLIQAAYDREVPEVKPLLRKAMHLAMPGCNKYCKPNDPLHHKFRHRGYVKTESGRRSRFPDEWKIHKALNAIIQGSAADINKRKLVEAFKMRKQLDLQLRITNHDELCGDAPSEEAAKQLEAQLNVQTTPMNVPILWSMGTGANWSEAKG